MMKKVLNLLVAGVLLVAGSFVSKAQPGGGGFPGGQGHFDPAQMATMRADMMKQTVNLTDDQRRILDAIGAYSAHVDDITEQTELPMARVLSQLTILEIRGLVRHEAGKRFARTEIHTK